MKVLSKLRSMEAAALTACVATMCGWGADPGSAPPSGPGKNAMAQVSTNAISIPQSVFVFDPKKSRDPFYPKWRPMGSVAVATNQPVVPASLPPDLNLKGISGSSGRRIALINNRPMLAGEETEFKTADGKSIRVRCAEIHEQSVVLIIAGSERKILTLGK